MIGEEKFIWTSLENDLLVHLFDLMMFCQSWDDPLFLSKGVVTSVIGYIDDVWVSEKFLEDNGLVQNYIYEYTDMLLGYIYVLVH